LINCSIEGRASPLTPKRSLRGSELSIRNLLRLETFPAMFYLKIIARRIQAATTLGWMKEEI
jgi:hypothetical protein